MGRYTSLERAFLTGSFTVIALIGAFVVFAALMREEPLGPAEADPPAPLASPLRRVPLRGRLSDLPGFDVHRALLSRTRVSLRSAGVALDGEVVPEDDGTFLLERPDPPPPGLTLRVSTWLLVNLFDRSYDRIANRDVPVPPSVEDLGEIPLPRAEDFGSIAYQVVDASGSLIIPEWIAMDAVEGTSTPDVGIARLDELNVSANAPAEYRRGGRGTILHVPPGDYWLRATVSNRLMPPVKVSVGRGQASATIAELASARRIRGIVREMGAGWPLEDVEITVSSLNYAGAGSRDPARVLGRTSRTGAYDLPLPDPLPAGGLRVTFVRRGYSSTDLNARAEDFKGGKTLVLDLDLGRD